MHLQWIGIGTGRDGTVSVNKLLNLLLVNGQSNGQSYHEFGSRDCYNIVTDILENGNHSAKATLRQIMEECKYEAIVGNGYAFALPYISDCFRGQVKLIHIQRRNIDACISSLVTDCVMFPDAYGYYSDREDIHFSVKRTTAFHFGEMTHAQWNRLSLNDKFLWYYKKTHALIEEHKSLFSDYLHVYTEDLNNRETIRKIAEFISAGLTNLPDPVHLNSHFYADIFKVESINRAKMQWLFREYNCNQAASDDLYSLRFFLDRFITLMGYQITGSISNINPENTKLPIDVFDELDQAYKLLKQRLEEIKDLRSKVVQKMKEEQHP